MNTVADVLAGRPPISLCVGCLAVATGRRETAVYSELEKLGARVKGYEAACIHCGLGGPVFMMTDA